VSGAAALAFVRQRHGLPRGDLDRILRQQAYLSGLAHQLLSARLFTVPAAVAALRQAITRYVVIDPGWDLAGLGSRISATTTPRKQHRAQWLDELRSRSLPRVD
jgi:anionic cell wall polymer biosynthesis LytR-Cps2A-Psr (LCP) family protein